VLELAAMNCSHLKDNLKPKGVRTALLVTRCFPPLFNVGGKRAYHFARYLPENGWRTVVVTNPIPPNYETDPDYLPPAQSLVLRSYQPGWWPQPHLSYWADPDPIGARRVNLTEVLASGLAFAPSAAIRLARVVREHEINVVVATTPPAVLMHAFLGARLAGIPICLDLRDPWSLNYLQRTKSRLRRHLECRLERLLFGHAARVIFASADACDAYRLLYPALAPKLASIPTGYDPESVVPRQAPAGPVTIVHFGNSFGSRRLDTVIRAMVNVKEVRLINFGRVQGADVDLART
jgi:glycosyltransferase involved in cell wall biosynthesis